MTKPMLVFIVGPTAAGKTETAAALTKKVSAEIISCDSMQIYKGMDIITSKPPASLRKKAVHHLIDIIEPTKEFNVSKFRAEALKKIKQILKKGKTPILVGGAGLYVSILIDGIFKVKSVNKSVRSRLYKEASLFGKEFLYEKLNKSDPDAAVKIHPNDTKRIIRALEVFETTGKPISALQKQRKGLANDFDIKIFCINMEREKLKERIDRRVEKMFLNGLVRETKRLLKSKLSRTAGSAIGIKELKGYFDGKYNLEEAKLAIKRNTKEYAKRQLTWFRKDKRIKWIQIKKDEPAEEIARKIWKELS